MKNLLKAKFSESLRSILPIAAIVALLSFTLTPTTPGTLLMFLIGVCCLVVGLSVFTLGAEMSMLPLGGKLGMSLAQSGKIWLIALVSFVIGIMITVAEPDLQISPCCASYSRSVCHCC